MSRSSDFPHTLDELLEYQAIAHEPSRRLGLGVVDYREVPAEQVLYRYDAPEWDWDNNVLVYRGDCALRDYFLQAEEHPDPLPLTLLLIAAQERTGAYKSWEGTTSELRGAMLDQRGLAWSSVDEYLRLFGYWDPQDHAAFRERIEDCKPFLEEIGVHVRRMERSREPGAPAGDEAAGGDDTYWIIEVPRWRHKRGYWA